MEQRPTQASSKKGVRRLQGTLKMENQGWLGLQRTETGNEVSPFSCLGLTGSPPLGNICIGILFLSFSPDFLGFPAKVAASPTLYQDSPIADNFLHLLVPVLKQRDLIGPAWLIVGALGPFINGQTRC